MPVRVNRGSQDRLKAARAAFRSLPAGIKTEFRKAQRAEIGAIWKAEVDKKLSRTVTPSQRLVLSSGVRVQAGLPAALVLASGKKVMSGGGTPSLLAKPMEFGSNRQANFTRYNRKSRNGGTHQVLRRTSAQMPAARKSGYVAYPAAAETIKRLTPLWVTSFQQQIYRATSGG